MRLRKGDTPESKAIWDTVDRVAAKCPPWLSQQVRFQVIRPYIQAEVEEARRREGLA